MPNHNSVAKAEGVAQVMVSWLTCASQAGEVLIMHSITIEMGLASAAFKETRYPEASVRFH